MIWTIAVILVIIFIIIAIFLALRHTKIEKAAAEGDEYYDRVSTKTKNIRHRLSRVKRDARGLKLDLKDEKRRK